jgi:hypothetical protein
MTEIKEELRVAIAGARAHLDHLEEMLAADRESPAAVRATLVKVIGALASHGRPPRSSKKPTRGLGYTFDEAQIVASIATHGSLPAAVRAHYSDFGGEWHDAVTRRIRKHHADLVSAGEEPDF